jgi:hypothetical protein
MRQVPDYGDDRNKGFCVHCGGREETSDHIPSKVLLDEPFPENLTACASCLRCNNGFSRDEEYLACVLECVLTGDVAPELIERSKIAHILRRSPKLAESLRHAKHVVDGQTIWDVDMDRVKHVLLKFARGHVAYELNEPRLDEPEFFYCRPLTTMSSDQRKAFEASEEIGIWPEVGSRALSRLLVVGSDVYEEGWLLVQEGRYRFRTLQGSGPRVRIVLREYLACEVAWD